MSKSNGPGEKRPSLWDRKKTVERYIRGGAITPEDGIDVMPKSGDRIDDETDGFAGPNSVSFSEGGRVLPKPGAE